MSPRPGGEADKFGNRFEGRWTVRQLLDVLSGRAESIMVEEVGELGAGIEFTVRRASGVIEAHQVKRQRGTANGWTVRALRDEGVISAAAAQVAAGRQFHFVSAVPARTLDELADQARRSDDVHAFVMGLSEGLVKQLDVLIAKLGSSAQAFETLRGTYARTIDERELTGTNAAFAGLLVAGAPAPTSAVALGDLVSDNLSRTLDARTVRELLADYELALAQLGDAQSVHNTVRVAFEAWRASIARELLHPVIARPQVAGEIVSALASSRGVTAVTGVAGAGKSAVLHQAVALLGDRWPVFAVRLDRVEPFSSPHELGAGRLGLPGSPVPSLAVIADGGDCLLIIDQLDAVSRASGRMPGSFDAVADLVREARAFPNMRVLLACREFDLENDDRLKELVSGEEATTIQVPTLGDEEISGAVVAMGLNPDRLTGAQRELLGRPLHLVLLAASANLEAPLEFTTAKDLMDRFYDAKRRACGERRPLTRFSETIAVLVEFMSQNQRLLAPQAVFDEDDLANDADVLASEQVIVADRQRVAFFHEAFFDYAFARRWIVRNQTLLEFVLEGEQDLFRRAQVRQILVHLRDEDPDRFVSEVGSFLASGEIRFHLKEVVVAILRSLPNPSHAEWELMQQAITARPSYLQQLWSVLRTGTWFDRADEEGALVGWLSSGDDELQGRVLEIMISEPRGREDRLAELLSPHVGTERFPAWLMWVTRFAEMRRSRPLFELVAAAVRKGVYDGFEHELWVSTHRLGEQHPDWACELLAAWFTTRPNTLALDDDGRVAALASQDYQLGELVDAAGARDPAAFVAVMLPYMRGAMEATSEGESLPRYDRHFSFRTWNDQYPDLAARLLHGVRDGLRAMAAEGHQQVDELLQALAQDDHDAAQWLLYQAMSAAPARYATWAAELLTEGESRLHSGYMSDPYWTTRELLQAISPIVDGEQYRRLEKAIMDLAPDWETPPGGYTQFTLLSALAEDRLSDAGSERLAAMRERFSRREPNEPTGIRSGTITSPIPQSAAQHMTDEEWLAAMRRYAAEDERDWSEFTGGARELSRVLEAEAKADPARFGRLALALDRTYPAAYLDAILRGVGMTDSQLDPQVVFELMRHVARIEGHEHDRALSAAVGRVLAEPVHGDIVRLLLDIALGSPNPVGEAWQTDGGGRQPFPDGDPFFNGINTSRGAAAIAVGDLLIHDLDGQRTAQVAPFFERLAGDPSVAVRACVAHVLTTGLRHAEREAVEAFATLVETDDRLLATRPVKQLTAYVGIRQPDAAMPVIARMLVSGFEKVREAGGGMAAFAALELDSPQLLQGVLTGHDDHARKGAAEDCAGRLPVASHPDAAEKALQAFFCDESESVRSAAAHVAGALRDQPLQAHRELLAALIASPAFPDALTQLLFTLDRAPERVDDLIAATAHRFLELFGGQIGDFSSRAAHDARKVGDLVLRAYTQAVGADALREALDLIDALLEHAAYGFAASVGAAER